MDNLSHLTIKQLNTLKSIFISGADWDEVSAIQYEIDNREKEILIKDWMIAFLIRENIKHKKILIDEYIKKLENLH